MQAVRNNNGNSGYSKHILNTHTYGSVTNTMKVLKMDRKGKRQNTLEGYYICKDKLQMNDTYIDTHNPIFEIIQEVSNSDKITFNPLPAAI
jgi:phenylalanyl-tRNA synthetase alpha subunit